MFSRLFLISFALCASVSLALPVNLRGGLSRRSRYEMLEKRVDVQWNQHADQGLTAAQRQGQEQHIHAHLERIRQEGTDPRANAAKAVVAMRLHPSKGNGHHPPDPIHHLTVEFQDAHGNKIGGREHVYRGGVGHAEAQQTHNMHLSEAERHKNLAADHTVKGIAESMLASHAEISAGHHTADGKHEAAAQDRLHAIDHREQEKHHAVSAKVHAAAHAFHNNMTKSNKVKH